MTVKRNQVASSNSSPHVYPRLAEGSPEAGELCGPNDAKLQLFFLSKFAVTTSCYSKECGNPGYFATKHQQLNIDIIDIAFTAPWTLHLSPAIEKHIQTPYLLPIWELSHPIETGFQKYSKWRFSRKRLGWMQHMIETTEVKIANFRSW